MKHICAVTTGRWDWAYLYWLMHDLQVNDKFYLSVIYPLNHHEWECITKEFNHLCPTNPIKSVEDYGRFYFDCYSHMKVSKPDMMVILGDRFESNAVAVAALLLNISIVHIHGGETTLGSFDNELRNSITMMADIHFTTHWQYAVNIARMKGLCRPDHYACYSKANDIIGNVPYHYEGNIYVTGSPGLDWLHRAKFKTKEELQQDISIDLNESFIIACFNPVTRDLENTERQMCEFLNALIVNKEQVLLIRPNFDPCNEKINRIIDDYKKFTELHIVSNLGHFTYLSLMQYASMMVGNSSSGIIEAASFNLPVINVGTRQEGRIKGSNIFDCGYSSDEILRAIDKAKEWNVTAGKCENIYGDGHSVERIIKILEELT